MTPTRLLLPAALGALLLLPTACDRVGSPFDGLGSRPPDEFAVMPRRPLAMPPGLGLPPPQPGAPSPLDFDPAREAQVALLGGPAAPAASRQTTAGEAALLESANATGASNEIRVALAEDEAADDGPYEAPTIFELFGMDDPDAPGRLDPQAEARRLQRGGVAAPTDPLAEPPEEGERGTRLVIGSEAEEDPFTIYRAPRQSRRP